MGNVRRVPSGGHCWAAIVSSTARLLPEMTPTSEIWRTALLALPVRPSFLGGTPAAQPTLSAIGKGSCSSSSSPFHFNCCWCRESSWEKRLHSLLAARKQTSVRLCKYKHFRVIRRSALKLINNIVWVTLFGFICPAVERVTQAWACSSSKGGCSSLWYRAGVSNQVAELQRNDPTNCPKGCNDHLYWPVDSEPKQQISSFYQP